MKLRMRQAIARAMADEMRSDPTVILLGEDVGEAEGPFKTSEALLSEFGSDRVRDTPISEMGFLGAALGAAATGLRPVVEIMFMEFMGVGLDMVVTEAAKLRYLSGGAFGAPLVVRASVGSGLGFGSQHSQTLESWIMGSAGVKLAVPSDADTAYGLLRAAIRDDDPVVILEPRVLYAERSEFNLDDAMTCSLGRAQHRCRGDDITIVAMGQMVRVAREVAAGNNGWTADVIDLMTLVPWDRDTVCESVRRTGRLAVVEEAPHTGGWGTEVAAHVATHCFRDLKAPVFRFTCPDVPVPYPSHLERRYLPSSADVAAGIGQLVKTDTAPEPWWTREGFIR